jgi:hypothetical protein
MGFSAFQREGYIAVGCTTGVYVSKRAAEYCESLALPLVFATNSIVCSFSESPGIQ